MSEFIVTDTQPTFFCKTFVNKQRRCSLAIQYRQGWTTWLWEARGDDWLFFGSIEAPGPGQSLSWIDTQSLVIEKLDSL